MNSLPLCCISPYHFGYQCIVPWIFIEESCLSRETREPLRFSRKIGEERLFGHSCIRCIIFGSCHGWIGSPCAGPLQVSPSSVHGYSMVFVEQSLRVISLYPICACKHVRDLSLSHTSRLDSLIFVRRALGLDGEETWERGQRLGVKGNDRREEEHEESEIRS